MSFLKKLFGAKESQKRTGSIERESAKPSVASNPKPLCIHEAARKGDLEMAKSLLKENPRLALSNDNSYVRDTPLHEAAYYGHKEVAELLLANKAEVNAKTKNGETPLHHAARENHKDMTELLLANRAEVNAKDNDGWTPLHRAADMGRKEVAELLLANKAEANAADNGGLTPLHLAAQRGHKDVTKSLLANRATINAKDSEGRTPLSLATEWGRKDVAEFLHQNSGVSYACPECGAPEPASMKERGVNGGFALFDCYHCSKPLQIPLDAITKFAGVQALCTACKYGSFVPASVWCKTCGMGLSTGWQKLVKPL